MYTLAVCAAALLTVCNCLLVLNPQSYLRLPNRSGNFQINSKSARESAFDETTNILYVVGYDTAMLHVIDVSDVANPTVYLSHNFDTAVYGRPLDVELCRSNTISDKLVISFDGQQSAALDGHIVFYRLFNSTTNSETLTELNPADPRVTVGPHPDNVKFSGDCGRLVVSNEGEPRLVDGTFYDPLGTISVLTINQNDNIPPSTALIDFTAYNNAYDTLLAQGFRYWLRTEPGTQTTVEFAKMVEPEYVAISPSNGFAYVTLQENNALARIDLENNVITNIYVMGDKNWENLDIDANNNDNTKRVRRKIKTIAQPDKVVFFQWNSVSYLLTTDEGKPSSVQGVGATYQDYATANSLSWDTGDSELDSDLNNNNELGRLFVSTIDGRGSTNQVPTAFGGRGFSIWNTQSMTRIYESGDQLERFSAENYNETFNGDCFSNFGQTPTDHKDRRSVYMGPEITAVAVGNFTDRVVMVLGGARNGLLYVYRLLPTAANPSPEFQSVHRAGQITGTWNNLYVNSQMGDAGITDIKMAYTNSPVVMVTSEISSSVSFYRLEDQNA